MRLGKVGDITKKKTGEIIFKKMASEEQRDYRAKGIAMDAESSGSSPYTYGPADRISGPGLRYRNN